MTQNLCVQIKYFHENIRHAVQLLSMQCTKINCVDRIRNTLILQQRVRTSFKLVEANLALETTAEI
jgi:hypothetical protein